MSNKCLSFHYMYLGCDPEFFFSNKDKHIIGAEKLIPQDGMLFDPTQNGVGNHGFHTALSASKSKIVIDGVQAELNPRPNTCRANLGNEIGACFRMLSKNLQNVEFNVDFSQIVKVDKKELDSLDAKSRVFGCAPSTNIYSETPSKITVNPAKYLYRSAGGHIHLGGERGGDTIKNVLTQPERVIPMLDIILGNTCVLLDRSEGNKERRKVYGRAGEYRTPAHGLEYRTLSNFWLQSYQLMSFVMGMARLAVIVIANSKPGDDYEKAILEKVDRIKIAYAINNNDFGLAYENFNKIEEILVNMLANYDCEHYPLNRDTIKPFKYVVEKGVNHFFKDNPLTHWINLPEGHGRGWERFCIDEVTKQISKEVGKVNV